MRNKFNFLCETTNELAKHMNIYTPLDYPFKLLLAYIIFENNFLSTFDWFTSRCRKAQML